MEVLLTGGSGFVAAHCIDYLLQAGHDVVFTVRSHDKGQKILDSHIGARRLSFVLVKDVAQENAFDEAIRSEPPFEADLIDPAVIGTTSILKAVKKFAPSVKSGVLTSSFAAMSKTGHHPKTYSEDDWNPVTPEEAAAAIDGGAAYCGSKASAERAAWEFVEHEKPGFELTTINPALVFGPIVNYLNSLDAVNTSNQRIRDMILGKFKDSGLPPSGMYIWIDMRDVALAHVKALDSPAARGKRLFCVAGQFSNADIAGIIKNNFPEYKDKLPVEPKDDKPADVYGFDNSRSINVLGLQYRPFDKCIIDTVKSLQAAGA